MLTQPNPTRQNQASSWPDPIRGSIRPVDNSARSRKFRSLGLRLGPEPQTPDSDSKPAGLGLESCPVRIGLGLNSRHAGLGLEKTWTRCNSTIYDMECKNSSILKTENLYKHWNVREIFKIRCFSSKSRRQNYCNVMKIMDKAFCICPLTLGWLPIDHKLKPLE